MSAAAFNGCVKQQWLAFRCHGDKVTFKLCRKVPMVSDLTLGHSQTLKLLSASIGRMLCKAYRIM